MEVLKQAFANTTAPECAASSPLTATATTCWPLVVILGVAWLFVEVLFYAIFHGLFLPLANQYRQPHPYRPPYHVSKHQLLAKIVHRIRQDVVDKDNGDNDENENDLRAQVTTFLRSWFRPQNKKKPSSCAVVGTVSSSGSGGATALRLARGSSLSRKSSDVSALPGVVPLTKGASTMTTCSDPYEMSSVSSITSSDDAMDKDKNGGDGGVVSSESVNTSSMPSSAWTIRGIDRSAMDSFLAWALWGRSVASLTAQDLEEIQRCYDVLRNELDLVFDEDLVDDTQQQQPPLEPRLLSLDPMNALHRPLAAYVIMYLLQTAVPGLFLWLAGFRRVKSKRTGLTGWYRPGRGMTGTKPMPLLFFHGIAPGGLCFYIPMVLWGLLRGDYDRACFLFDSPNIGGTLDFTALTEQETVLGVQEIVDAELPNSTVPLVACGHSFGSCQLTWLLSSPQFHQRIRQYVLLDPVTVLLSDPDVMANFLYCSEVSKIRLLASSELFTEYYLRRHFAWYNSELWLDEVFGDGKSNNRNDAHVVIALAESDQIVNAPKVKKHLDLFQKRHCNDNLSYLYWKGAKHAACVTKPWMWRDIRKRMLRNELEIFQQKQQ